MRGQPLCLRTVIGLWHLSWSQVQLQTNMQTPNYKVAYTMVSTHHLTPVSQCMIFQGTNIIHTCSLPSQYGESYVPVTSM